MVLARECMLSRFSCVQLFLTLWTVAHHDPLEWLSFPPRGDLPDSGIKPISLMSSALADWFFTLVPPGKPLWFLYQHHVYLSVTQSCLTLCSPMHCSPPGSSVHGWDFPGKNTGMDSHSLLQGILPTKGSMQETCIPHRFFTI